MKLPSLSFIPWGRVGLAVGLLVTVALTAAWKVEERRANKLQAQVVKWQREVGRLTEAGKQMQGETTRTITRWKERKVYVEREAKRVEDAPLPGQCRTPDLVLEAVE